MATSTASAGKILLFVTLSVLFYYIFWVSILPFMRLEDGNYIFIIPTFLLLLI